MVLKYYLNHSRLDVDLCRLLHFVRYNFQLLFWIENRLFRLALGAASRVFGTGTSRPELFLRLRTLRRGGTHCDLALFELAMAVFNHVQFL